MNIGHSHILPLMVLVSLGPPRGVCRAVVPADTAFLWLSECPFSPAAGQIPNVHVDGSSLGSSRSIHIWGQPGVGLTLQGFSLHLEAEQAGLPLADVISLQQVEIHDPIVGTDHHGGTLRRHGFVHDSDTGLAIVGNAVEDMKGFSLFVDPSDPLQDGAGIGPNCGDDPACSNTAGSDRWLIGSIRYESASLNSSALRLAVGTEGLLNSGEMVGDPTNVVFGTPNDTVINADVGGVNTAADAVVTVSPASMAYQWTGAAGSMWGQNLNWETGGGVPASPPTGADSATIDGGASQVVSVQGCQAAKVTHVDQGRLHVSSNGALASRVEVAAGAALSGAGWITAGDAVEFDPNSQFAIDSTEPLRVISPVTVTGAELVVTPDYAQPQNSISDAFSFLESFGGVTGTFATTVNEYLGHGVYLHDLQYEHDVLQNNSRTTAELRYVPGDFNGDGTVDAADITVWRDTKGAKDAPENLPADASGNGVVGVVDRTAWVDNFGASVDLGGGSQQLVPEPTTTTGCCWLILWILSQAAINRRRPSPELAVWQQRPRSLRLCASLP